MIETKHRYTDSIDELTAFAELKGYRIAMYISNRTPQKLKIGVYPDWIKTKPRIGDHCIKYYESRWEISGRYEDEIINAIEKMREYIRSML